MSEGAALVVVCGLLAEARIAAAPGVRVIAGGDHAKLAGEIAAAAPSARALISFGVAGGLAPGLKPGAVGVAGAIIAPDGTRFATDPLWAAAIATKLGVPLAIFAGVDAPLVDVVGKAKLRRRTGAAMVDMESHVVARAAVRHGLRLAAIRVVTDPAERSLPHAATVGMRADGKVDLAAIVLSLGRNPGQLPSLIRTGLDARAAFAALLGSRKLLGPGFALLDL